MQQVISAEQARAISGKATGPLTLPQYEQACQLLAECTSILEARKWVDAASAYETIARIKNDERAMRLSKALLYQAALACREIAEAEAKKRFAEKPRGSKLPCPPVNQVLQENGFSRAEAKGASHLSNIAKKGAVSALLARKKPPGLVAIGQLPNTPAGCVGQALSVLAYRMRACSPGQFKKYAATEPGRSKWRENAEEIHDWLGIVLGRD